METDVIVFVDDKVERGFKKNQFFVSYNKKVFDDEAKDFITVKASQSFVSRELAEDFITYPKSKIKE
jgi:hypothetical protein